MKQVTLIQTLSLLLSLSLLASCGLFSSSSSVGAAASDSASASGIQVKTTPTPVPTPLVPAKLSCSLTLLSSSLQITDFGNPSTTLTLIATGKPTSAAIDGNSLSVPGTETVFSFSQSISPTVSTTYNATVSDGTNNATCSVSVEVTTLSGPICSVISMTNGTLQVLMSKSTASASVEIQILNESDQTFPLNIDTTKPEQDIPYSSCCGTVNVQGNAVTENDPANGPAAVSFIPIDANGTPGNACSVSIPFQ